MWGQVRLVTERETVMVVGGDGKDGDDEWETDVSREGWRMMRWKDAARDSNCRRRDS